MGLDIVTISSGKNFLTTIPASQIENIRLTQDAADLAGQYILSKVVGQKSSGKILDDLGAKSAKLENISINHYAEEYIGTHGNKLWTDDGRALNDMLPFFDTYLKFEELKFKTTQDLKSKKVSSTPHNKRMQ